jgi:hypothetical protein
MAHASCDDGSMVVSAAALSGTPSHLQGQFLLQIMPTVASSLDL